jgi:hypothetical protein
MPRGNRVKRLWKFLPFLRFQNRTASSSNNNNNNNAAASNTTDHHLEDATATADHWRDDEGHPPHYELYIPQQSFEPFMWGCQDEIGTATCLGLPDLFADDVGVMDGRNPGAGAGAGSNTCRWPLAELCLSTCGQCPLVEAAGNCISLDEEMDSRLVHDEFIDWQAFFEDITSPNRTEPYLKGARILNRETPWVAEFPNYMTNDEADELIRIAQLEGYRIEDEHPKHIRDVNVTNCDSARCMRQPIVTELYRRVSEFMGFHPNNFESMEFIDYGPGQHYVWHADEYAWKYPIRDPLAVLAGPRLLTMFHYLSDVEEGGETAFAGPDSTGKTKRLAVTPKKGMCVCVDGFNSYFWVLP